MLVLLVFSLKPITTFSLSTIDCKKTIKVQNKCLTKMLQVQQFAIRQFLSIALYYISLLIGFGKYSIGWEPPRGVCRLEMELLRPKYTKMGPFFLKIVKCPC